MDFLELARKRVSVRKYQPVPVEREKTDAILEAMRLAPSAMNRQEWKFLVIESKTLIDGLSQATRFEWLKGVPAVIAVIGLDCGVMTNGHRSDTIDLSIALTMGMMEATDLGLGTCWLAHYEEKDVRAVLSLPDSQSVAALMPVGYPAETPDPRPRKALTDVAEYR